MKIKEDRSLHKEEDKKFVEEFMKGEERIIEITPEDYKRLYYEAMNELATANDRNSAQEHSLQLALFNKTEAERQHARAEKAEKENKRQREQLDGFLNTFGRLYKLFDVQMVEDITLGYVVMKPSWGDILTTIEKSEKGNEVLREAMSESFDVLIELEGFDYLLHDAYSECPGASDEEHDGDNCTCEISRAREVTAKLKRLLKTDEQNTTSPEVSDDEI